MQPAPGAAAEVGGGDMACDTPEVSTAATTVTPPVIPTPPAGTASTVPGPPLVPLAATTLTAGPASSPVTGDPVSSRLSFAAECASLLPTLQEALAASERGDADLAQLRGALQVALRALTATLGAFLVPAPPPTPPCTGHLPTPHGWDGGPIPIPPGWEAGPRPTAMEDVSVHRAPESSAFARPSPEVDARGRPPPRTAAHARPTPESGAHPRSQSYADALSAGFSAVPADAADALAARRAVVEEALGLGRHRPMVRRILPRTVELMPDLRERVDRVRSLYVRDLPRQGYAAMRATLSVLVPSLAASAVLDISYVGPLTEIVLTSVAEADTLRHSLPELGVRVLPCDFDPRVPLRPAQQTDETACAAARSACAQRYARTIARTRNLLLATYLQRRFPDLAAEIDESLRQQRTSSHQSTRPHVLGRGRD